MLSLKICFLNMYIALILIIDGTFCQIIQTYQILLGVILFINETVKSIMIQKANQKWNLIFFVDLFEIVLLFESMFQCNVQVNVLKIQTVMITLSISIYLSLNKLKTLKKHKGFVVISMLILITILNFDFNESIQQILFFLALISVYSIFIIIVVCDKEQKKTEDGKMLTQVNTNKVLQNYELNSQNRNLKDNFIEKSHQNQTFGHHLQNQDKYIDEQQLKLQNQIIESDNSQDKSFQMRQRSNAKQLIYFNINKEDEEIYFDTIKGDFFNLLPFGLIIFDEKQNIIFKTIKCEKILQCSGKKKIKQTIEHLLSKKNLLNYPNQERKNCCALTQSEFNELLERNCENIIDILIKQQAFTLQKQCTRETSQLQNQFVCSCNDADVHALYFENILEIENQEKTIQLQIIQNNINIDSKKSKLIILLEDVTQKRKFEITEKQLKFQKSLLLSFSHELRTPLNSSIQGLEQALVQCEQEIVENAILPAYCSNVLLLYQINDILDLAAFESKSFIYNKTEFKIKDIIYEIQQLFKKPFEEKKIDFQTINNANQKTIRSDKGRVLQVLINILKNTTKYSKQKSQVSLIFSKADERLIKVEIVDTGSRIEEEKLKKIQSQLEKHDDNYDNEILGLGYRISSKIIHGLAYKENFLKLEQADKWLGISFLISDSLNDTLFTPPFVRQNTPKMLRKKSVDSPIQKLKQISLRKSKFLFNGLLKSSSHDATKCECFQVLIADDEPFNHIPVKQFLKQLNIQSEAAYNGQEALELVEKKMATVCDHKLYDLILMDIQMPVLDGLRATQKINELYKKKNLPGKPPIIINSAFDTLENVKKAEDFGAIEFIPKPLNKEILENLVKRYVK